MAIATETMGLLFGAQLIIAVLCLLPSLKNKCLTGLNTIFNVFLSGTIPLMYTMLYQQSESNNIIALNKFLQVKWRNAVINSLPETSEIIGQPLNPALNIIPPVLTQQQPPIINNNTYINLHEDNLEKVSETTTNIFSSLGGFLIYYKFEIVVGLAIVAGVYSSHQSSIQRQLANQLAATEQAAVVRAAQLAASNEAVAESLVTLNATTTQALLDKDIQIEALGNALKQIKEILELPAPEALEVNRTLMQNIAVAQSLHSRLNVSENNYTYLQQNLQRCNATINRILD